MHFRGAGTIEPEGGAVVPAVTHEEAIQLLTKAARADLPPDDLPQVYREVFPRGPAPDGRPLTEAIVQHLVGLQPDELVDLWRLFRPDDRNVWYNEEEERIYLNEGLDDL